MIVPPEKERDGKRRNKMTRKQIKIQIAKIREMIYDLRMEVEETYESIEPYEGKDDLTPQQEERQEWLDNCRYELEQAYDNLNEFEY